MNEIKRLFDIIGQKKTAVYLVLLSIVVAMVEFVGLALIVPYISIATQQKIPQNTYIENVNQFFNINNFSEFVILISIIIILFYIFRLSVNLFFHYVSLRFINQFRHIIMSKLFAHYAHIDYAHFVFKNTSELKKTLLAESLNTQNVFKAMLNIVSESFVLLFLLGLVLYTDWKLSFVLLMVFIVVFYSFITLFNNKILEFSKSRVEIMKGVHQEVDETLNNFKFIKLVGAEGIRISNFQDFSFKMSNINIWVQFMNLMPKYILETFGLIIIVGITFYSNYYGSSKTFIVVLGIYSIAFYRGLPSLNKIIISFNTFQYFKNTIDQVYESLKVEREKVFYDKGLFFKKKIELKDIVFQYMGTHQNLFNKYNLTINKGEKVALVGSSGSGKSTLVDIIMGILKLKEGKLLVDGNEIEESNMKSWRGLFGYIPQEIYLYDGTVSDNVAFGREYNEKRIVEVLKQANIYQYLQTKEGINTLVGEGGIQLSGGQKQRIAIARALYHDPEILVLDEATSALDNETEEKIMDEIYHVAKDKTLIVIAHRLSTIEKCNRTIKL